MGGAKVQEAAGGSLCPSFTPHSPPSLECRLLSPYFAGVGEIETLILKFRGLLTAPPGDHRWEARSGLNRLQRVNRWVHSCAEKEGFQVIWLCYRKLGHV